MQETIAVIDTETTYYDDVMSIGIVIADRKDLTRKTGMYYVFPEEYRKPAMYSSVLFIRNQNAIRKSRKDALAEIRQLFRDWNVTTIFAYNARFDFGHLPELSDYAWKDIMKLAAYRQHNPSIPADCPCCKTGRMKSGYGVEPVMRLLSGDQRYEEVHNALCDAEDELRIMQLLGHDIDRYPVL